MYFIRLIGQKSIIKLKMKVFRAIFIVLMALVRMQTHADYSQQVDRKSRFKNAKNQLLRGFFSWIFEPALTHF